MGVLRPRLQRFDRRWKNSDAGARARQLSLGSRLLIAPILLFGPVSGAVLAGLIYGDGSPGAMSHATRLRQAATWVRQAAVIRFISTPLSHLPSPS